MLRQHADRIQARANGSRDVVSRGATRTLDDLGISRDRASRIRVRAERKMDSLRAPPAPTCKEEHIGAAGRTCAMIVSGTYRPATP